MGFGGVVRVGINYVNGRVLGSMGMVQGAGLLHVSREQGKMVSTN